MTIEVVTRTESWALERPFKIAGYPPSTAATVAVVELKENGISGRGEASGVYYRNDTPAAVVEQIRQLAPEIRRGLDRQALQTLLPAGGTRNALDCALWELDARRRGVCVWQLAGLSAPGPLLTMYTIGADTPSEMAAQALRFSDARAIKLKLTGDGEDAGRVQAVRTARGDVSLAVDANQGFTPASLYKLIPTLIAARVSLIEQPFAVGREQDLRGLHCPIPLAADESVQVLEDLEAVADLFEVVNIKLDKCGGLTHALAMIKEAERLGLKTMVGNMTGTSWSHGPAFLVGQSCAVVDLDGPLLLADDRTPGVAYLDGYIHCRDEVWGGPSS